MTLEWLLCIPFQAMSSDGEMRQWLCFYVCWLLYLSSTESFDIGLIFWFFVLTNNFLLYLLTMCVYGVRAHTQACTPMPGDACLSQRTCRSSFSPSTLWIPGIELRSLGFAASTCTCWLTLQALVPFTVSPRCSWWWGHLSICDLPLLSLSVWLRLLFLFLLLCVSLPMPPMQLHM